MFLQRDVLNVTTLSAQTCAGLAQTLLAEVRVGMRPVVPSDTNVPCEMAYDTVVFFFSFVQLARLGWAL